MPEGIGSMRNVALSLVLVLPSAALAADVRVRGGEATSVVLERGAYIHPADVVVVPVLVPVVRRDRWSTTYYPALPWGGLRKEPPISLSRTLWRERRPVATRVLRTK